MGRGECVDRTTATDLVQMARPHFRSLPHPAAARKVSGAAYNVRRGRESATGGCRMTKQRVLISGAGIAGPALAFWLDRSDFDVTVVERAPVLREGGQAVDFRGPVHREVLERMDLWDAIHQHRKKHCDVILLDRRGGPMITLPAVM